MLRQVRRTIEHMSLVVLLVVAVGIAWGAAATATGTCGAKTVSPGAKAHIRQPVSVIAASQARAVPRHRPDIGYRQLVATRQTMLPRPKLPRITPVVVRGLELIV